MSQRPRNRKAIRAAAADVARAEAIARVHVALTLAVSHLETGAAELSTAVDLVQFAARELAILHVPAGVAAAEADLRAVLRPSRLPRKKAPK